MSLRVKKTARIREEIMQSALKLLAERGYHGTTMEEIASHLLMTKGALYYYFKDKQDLVYQSQLKILQQSINNIQNISKTDADPAEKLEKMMRAHIEYAVREKAGFVLMINPDEIFSDEQLKEILRLRDRYAACYDALLEEGVKEGVFSIAELKMIRNILLGAMNWVTQWYSPEGKMNETEFAATLAKYLMPIVRK